MTALKKTTADYLQELLKELEKVQEFTRGGREEFFRNDQVNYSVIRCYEIIGEIIKRLPKSIRTQYTSVDWHRLAGFRDFLAHNYDEIILDFVWVAVEDVPNLSAKVKEVLQDLTDTD